MLKLAGETYAEIERTLLANNPATLYVHVYPSFPVILFIFPSSFTIMFGNFFFFFQNCHYHFKTQL